jgi:hypothetical protein
MVNGQCVAVCAASSAAKAGDLYLDDMMHGALSTKFALDFNSMFDVRLPVDQEIVKLMEVEER